MSLCYLDANATTFMPDIVIKSMLKWTNKGNPSATYKSAKDSKDLINNFSNLIMSDNNLSNFTLLFTSGASESNSHILISSVRSFLTKTGHLPHIIISSVEHKSILKCCEDLRIDKLCQYSIVNVQLSGSDYGMVDPNELERLIKPNTCLISIMTANNETGIINNIPLLASISHKHKIPFHTDCTQSFGKFGLYNGVDAMSLSFHKIYGPPGLGCLLIRNTFIDGYNLKALISGTQNKELRGGTENMPAIGAAYAAYRYTNLYRDKKNKYLMDLKNMFMYLINSSISCFYIEDFITEKNQKNKIFWIANKDENKMLPNTILLAVYKSNFCNIRMKHELEKNNIIISIGSACNTSSNNASSVIQSLNIPIELQPGVLRISLSDTTTKENITTFVSLFIKLLSINI